MYHLLIKNPHICFNLIIKSIKKDKLINIKIKQKLIDAFMFYNSQIIMREDN